MIQASELRIGNLVFDDRNLICKIIGFKPFEHSVRCDELEGCDVLIDIYKPEGISKDWGCDIRHIKPIELTEEILLKCGFEYSEVLCLYRLKESNVIYEYCEEEDEYNYFIHFYHDGTNLIVESSNEYGEMANMKFNHIKYLHQLQNLYFALTGKDLEINFNL